MNYLPCVKSAYSRVSPAIPRAAAPLIAISGYIPKTTPFPEESLRLVKAMLRPSVQRRYFKAGLAFPISRKALSMEGLDELSQTMSTAVKTQVFPMDPRMEDAIESIIVWDLKLYLSGGLEGVDILDRIERKLEYFMSAYSPELFTSNSDDRRHGP